MYYLQLFNIDVRGRRADIVHMGGPFEFAMDAILEADRLRLGTHFRVTDEGGHLILEDRRPELDNVTEQSLAPIWNFGRGGPLRRN
jgi:hypothetical protein